jgi:hypothetical protein
VRPHRALGTTAGEHRWVWDLHGERPLADSYQYPISAVPHDTPREPEGPRVLPGAYTVKLTVDGKTLTAALEVKLDPRVKIAPAALAQLSQLEQRLAEQATHGSQLVMAAQSASDQLAKLPAQPEPLKAQIADVTTKLTMVLSGPKGPPPGPGRERPPSLSGSSGKLLSIYRMIQVDAAPTPVQIAEATKAERELATFAKQWDALKSGELTALNTALAAAGLSPIRPELRPETRQDDGDEE